MKHVVMFSYGLGSWAAAKLVVRKYGAENTLLLHTSTNYEDEDTEKWGAAAAKNVGAELIVIADGRDIWEVFKDERYLGNTRADPCSKILKRELADRWMNEHFTPKTATRYVGIHWSEAERHDRIRERLPEWTVEAPLRWPPLLGYDVIAAWAEKEGLWQHELYKAGFPHANCGGRCVKQGQGGWKNLLEKFPERYGECEAKEQELREYLGKDVSILRDRRGGTVKPLTLRTFRLRLAAGGKEDDSGFGGCSCFAGPEEE